MTLHRLSEYRRPWWFSSLPGGDGRFDLPAPEGRVLREGLVLARIRDDVFELQIPEGYEPRAFPNPAPSRGADA